MFLRVTMNIWNLCIKQLIAKYIYRAQQLLIRDCSCGDPESELCELRVVRRSTTDPYVSKSLTTYDGGGSRR
jgi:hypothetical protein